jgi:predicted metalloprotease
MKTLVPRLAVAAALVLGLAAPAAARTDATAAPAAAATHQCRPPSLHDCFTYSTMRSYADQIIPLIERWAKASYRRMPLPSKYVYIGAGEAEDSLCAGGDVYSDGFAYCSVDREIYLGQDSLWMFYARIGDAAPAVGLAHEWGHHIQNIARVPSPRTYAQSVRHENQADCIAGAWVRWAINRDVFERDDIGELPVLLRAIASAESDQRDHGTLRERTISMNIGLREGLWGCNRFYPATPVVTR